MQRLALARLFARTPRLLLIDEPTSALDYANALGISEAIVGHMSDIGGAVVIASHDPNVLERCHHISVMRDGEILETGNFDSLRSGSDAFRQVIESGGAISA